MAFIGADPIFAPLHDSPRYQRIVRGIGLQVVPNTAR
jgi:hypothetical protein